MVRVNLQIWATQAQGKYMMKAGMMKTKKRQALRPLSDFQWTPSTCNAQEQRRLALVGFAGPVREESSFCEACSEETNVQEEVAVYTSSAT